MLQRVAVTEQTLALLKELQEMDMLSNLRLVGGTALALQLGHRLSIDLDLFGPINIGYEELEIALLQKEYNIEFFNKSAHIKQLIINNIKVDIVNHIFPWLDEAIETENIKLAGLKDIAAMKLEAITGRGSRKDFVDLYFLLQHFSLKEMLDFYSQKYKNSLFMVMMSLGYFADAEKLPMPEMLVPISWEEMKNTIQKAIDDYNEELRKNVRNKR